MIDKQKAFNSQISDFLAEYKHRFTNVNHSGMPGKVGYSTKLNIKEAPTLTIYLTEHFPLNAPIIYVYPKIQSSYVDDVGRVKDNCLSYWNVNSTLVSTVRSILIKFEVENPDLGLSSQKFNNNNYRNAIGNVNYNQNNNFNYNNNMNSYHNNNNNVYNSTCSIKNSNTIYNDLNNLYSNNAINTNVNNSLTNSKYNSSLDNELNNKSIEELIYIYLNQEEFVSDFMTSYKKNVTELKLEVDKLYDECKEKKLRYSKEMSTINNTLSDFNLSKEELKKTSYEKVKIDNKYTLDNLLDKLNNDLNKTSQDRQKVISEFLSKKINYEDFINSFKDPSYKYHSLSILKDKLYHLKNAETSN